MFLSAVALAIVTLALSQGSRKLRPPAYGFLIFAGAYQLLEPVVPDRIFIGYVISAGLIGLSAMAFAVVDKFLIDRRQFFK